MGFEMDSHGDVQNAKSKRIVPSAANKDLYLCIETGAKYRRIKALSPRDNSNGLRQKRRVCCERG